MSFTARDLTIHLVPGVEGPPLLACNVCNSTPGAPKPNCPAPSKCQGASVKPPKKRAEMEALDLAALRGQLRETLHRHQ